MSTSGPESNPGRPGESGESGQSSPAPPGPKSRTMSWWYVVIPAVTFVLGLVLGGLVIGLGSDGDDEAAQEETDSASPTPGESDSGESGDTTVVVPRECIEAAETAQEATQLILDNLSAIKNFEGQRIIDLLDRLEELSTKTQELGQSCSGVDISTSDVPSATP